MFSFSEFLIKEDSLEKTRNDFENKTVSVLNDFSGEIPESNDRLLKKIDEIKRNKTKKIENSGKLQYYLGGLSGLIERLISSVKITSVGMLISVVWAFLELRKIFFRKNLEIIEKSKFKRKAGDNKTRNLFRNRWNDSLGKTSFLATVLFMAIMYSINKKVYRGSFEIYYDGMRDYMRTNSKLSAFKTAYESSFSK